MTGSLSSEYERWHLQTHAFWLPPHGRGNGLDATGWAPIADVDESREATLLAALRTARIAAYAGRVRSGQVRFWVDSMRYSTAEDVLRHELSADAP